MSVCRQHILVVDHQRRKTEMSGIDTLPVMAVDSRQAAVTAQPYRATAVDDGAIEIELIA